jgi:hypothetical protein
VAETFNEFFVNVAKDIGKDSCANFEYSKVSLEAVNKPFYGFSQYMCNSVEVVKNMSVRQMFDRSDTL